ncbi:response regulator [Paenibacillus sepulcri]|uniref:Response regulator n=1 Tax=Paenibacillus sepulcri TaxID=359917 RepID=A0ABS7BXJ2_9BACL|nr:response regulator [Paenibacillus sepulcri]
MKLLVVDDEKMTREGIARSIEGGLSIQQIELADSGITAIEKLDAFQPDIILTDVRMPLMDGIEFAARVRILLPDCKIIFMSGFTDKEYLKSAIQLKALNYIEKPIDFDELKEALQTAVNLRLEEQLNKQRVSELNRTLLESIPLIKAEIASQLMTGKSDIEHLLARARSAGLALPRRGFCQTVIVRFDPRQSGWTDSEWMSIRLRINREAEAFFIEKGYECLSVLKDGSAMVCHLLNMRSPIPTSMLEALAELLSAANSEQLHLTIACGDPVSEMEQIFQSYKQANSLLPASFYHASGSVLTRTEMTPVIVFDPSIPGIFADCIALEKQSKAEQILVDLAVDLRLHDQTPVESTKYYFFKLLTPLFEDNEKWCGHETDHSLYWDILNRFVSLHDIVDFALQTLHRHFDEYQKQKGTRRIVREVIRYIQASYADEALSIQKICGHTFLTPAYLCSLFKLHTNQTINGYLTEYRINKAKSLMSDSKLTIQQIAVLVGYSNSNYFAKVFRKMVGMTPTEYREGLI